MTQAERQQKEIETIRPRSFTLKLSDADVQRLYELAYTNGTTPAEIIEGFIMDLVGGTYTHGSDERELAQAYFDRCNYDFGMQGTFLSWLLTEWRLDEMADALKELQEGKSDLLAEIEDAERLLPGILQKSKQDLQAAIKDAEKLLPEIWQESIADIQEIIADAEKAIADIYAEYKEDTEKRQDTAQGFTEAIQAAQEYIDELESMKNQ